MKTLTFSFVCAILLGAVSVSAFDDELPLGSSDTELVFNGDSHSFLGKRSMYTIATPAQSHEPVPKVRRTQTQNRCSSQADAIIEALRTSEHIFAKELVERAADIDKLGCEGLAPLHVAAFIPDRCETIRYLVARGADINLPSQNGERPIHHAIRGLFFRRHEGSIVWNLEQDNIMCLLKYHPTLMVSDESGHTPLMAAIEFAIMGETQQRANILAQLIQLLLDNGSSLHEVLRLPSSTQERLFRMAMSNQSLLSVAQYLLARASPNYVSSLIFTSSEWLDFFRNHETVAILRGLLEKGFSPHKTQENGQNVAIMDFNAILLSYHTPLTLAVLSGSVDAVKLLLEFGATTEVTDVYSNSALMLAAGAKCGIVLPAAGPDRPARSAAIIKLLIAAGADVNAQNFQGETALLISFDKNWTETVEVLLDAGADMSLSNLMGEYLALRQGVLTKAT